MLLLAPCRELANLLRILVPPIYINLGLSPSTSCYNHFPCLNHTYYRLQCVHLADHIAWLINLPALISALFAFLFSVPLFRSTSCFCYCVMLVVPVITFCDTRSSFNVPFLFGSLVWLFSVHCRAKGGQAAMGSQ